MNVFNRFRFTIGLLITGHTLKLYAHHKHTPLSELPVSFRLRETTPGTVGFPNPQCVRAASSDDRTLAAESLEPQRLARFGPHR